MRSRLTYSLWKESNRSILEGFSHKKALIPFSGGKDSSVVLSLIRKASEEFNFSFEAQGVMFPPNVFLKKEVEEIDAYWNQKDVRIAWYNAAVSDTFLATSVEEGRSPCLDCIQIKKKVLVSKLNQTVKGWDSVVIIMSYSLWDLASAMLEHISKSSFHDGNYSKALQDKSSKERFIETAQRFYPLLKIKGGPSIYKPLIKINDQDIKGYVSEKKIPLTTTPCPYKEFRPKRILETYYEKSDLFFEYDKVFDFSKKALDLPDKSYYEEIDMDKYVTVML